MEMPNSSHKNVMELFRLDGRIALVTGGSKGLGRVIAQAFAEAGADVVVASRTPEDCRKAADEIAESTGRRAGAFAVDVTSADELKRLSAEIESSFGEIDILVNNAGINIRGLIDELDESDFESVMATNLTAPFLCSKIFGSKMAGRGWGRVINLGSIMSVISLPGRAPYASSLASLGPGKNPGSARSRPLRRNPQGNRRTCAGAHAGGARSRVGRAATAGSLARREASAPPARRRRSVLGARLRW